MYLKSISTMVLVRFRDAPSNDIGVITKKAANREWNGTMWVDKQ